MTQKLFRVASQFKQSERLDARSLQVVTAHTSAKDEESVIEQAGSGNTITIATSGRMGRGTDIHNSAEDLHVLLTYMKDGRDLKQTRSRTARYGRNGTIMILDASRYDIDPHHSSATKHYIDKYLCRVEQDAYVRMQASAIYSWIRDTIQESCDEAQRSSYLKDMNQYPDQHIRTLIEWIESEKEADTLKTAVDVIIESIDPGLQSLSLNMDECNKRADLGKAIVTHYKHKRDTLDQDIVQIQNEQNHLEKLKAEEALKK